MEFNQCNCCGREIKIVNGIQKEDILCVSKEWGYFSEKDMERHRFIICESCYNNWVSGFKIPPKVEEKTEAL